MMRVYLHTFGCKANQYDTEAVRQALEASGATPVDDPALADAAIVNSCTVTHVAEAKMRGLVRRLARQRPALRTVVMGCAAALDDGAIARLPGVEAVVGGAEPSRVLAALGLSAPNAGELLRSFARGSRAWLKIQETLGRLVEELVRQVPRVRFRLSSVEATEVDHSLAELMIGEPLRLAPHLHAPLQSGSDRLLKRMGRHWYTARAYRDRIEWLAERLPRLGLGADVIVGFPGETARDHAATMELVSALPFTYLHVFPYSERPGASARRLGRPVDPPVAAARSAELRDLAASHRQRYQANRDGGPADVVLMARQAARFQGLTEDYLTVYLPADRARPLRLPATLRRRGGVLLAEAA
ncbi:MAG: radical SAM protein [Gemmatimonadetes bacterium]|nr:radical SAM protein [Gemmatimonadota bacterium]